MCPRLWLWCGAHALARQRLFSCGRTASQHVDRISVLWLRNLELMLNLILFVNTVKELSIIWKL